MITSRNVLYVACAICGSGEIHSYPLRKEYAHNSIDCYVFEFSDSVCMDCGFVFSISRPNSVMLEKYYSNYLKSLSNVGSAEIDKRISIIQNFIKPPSSILEIGGGYSGFCEKLEVLGYSVLNKDPSRHDVSAQVDEAGYDLVCSYYVGEHVLDINQWMSWMLDKLALGGKLLIEVPNFSKYPHESFNNEHINHFKLNDLKLLFEQYGVKILDYSEENVGRYFGLWVIGERELEVSSFANRSLKQNNIDASLSLVEKTLAEKNRKQKNYKEISDEIEGLLNAGINVGIWPINEIASNILRYATYDCNAKLNLFDIDPEKHGMNWCGLSNSILNPVNDKLASCEKFYLCSPYYNQSIKEELVVIGFADEQIIDCCEI